MPRFERPAEDAKDNGCDRFVDAPAILPVADIQRVVGAILEGPVLARQLQEAGGIGLIRSQAGHNPDRLNFLLRVRRVGRTRGSSSAAGHGCIRTRHNFEAKERSHDGLVCAM